MSKQDDTTTKALNVYEAIAKVQGLLAKGGIGKDRKNKEQGYSFRGIDDVYNALAPILSESGLCILPRILSRELKERTTAKGNPLFNVVVEAEFDFVAAADGSKHTVRTYGEAMDTADKATNKAMSAAYKYACLQTFCIPTEGDNDADGTTPEVAGHQPLFKDQSEREAYRDLCLTEIGKATSVEGIRSVKTGNLARWNAIGASTDKDDQAAWSAIKTNYNAKFKSLSEKTQPTTVDAVMRGNQLAQSVLGDDTIE